MAPVYYNANTTGIKYIVRLFQLLQEPLPNSNVRKDSLDNFAIDVSTVALFTFEIAQNKYQSLDILQTKK